MKWFNKESESLKLGWKAFGPWEGRWYHGSFNDSYSLLSYFIELRWGFTIAYKIPIVFVDANAFAPELIGKQIFWLGRYEKSSDEAWNFFE